MITTATANYRTTEGANQIFEAGASIIVEHTYRERADNFLVHLRILGVVEASEFAQDTLLLTNAEVSAETGTGTTEVDKHHNRVQKAVKTKLSAITGNGSTVFTIV